MLSSFINKTIPPRDQLKRRQLLFSALSLSSLSFSSWIHRSASKSYCSAISTTHRNPNVKIPPRFGFIIPTHLLPHGKRSLTTISKDKDTQNNLDQISQSSSKRNDCPMCKKYSQGPCGEIFTSWLSCIDSNVGTEQKCDEYVKELKLCLENHNDYYEKIDAYGESKEDGYEDGSIEKWKSFIDDLELDASFRMFGEEDKQYQPDLQVRLKSKMGAAMFHPNMKGDILLLVYVKDQDGNILGAGSVDELFYWIESEKQDKDQDENDGYFILRFRVADDTVNVTAYALYGKDKEENAIIANEHDDVPIIRWRKQQIKRH